MLAWGASLIRVKGGFFFLQADRFIEKAELFKGLKEASKRSLSSICVPRSFAKRETLFLEGQRGEALYLLARGEVQLHKTSEEGREVVIRVLRPGEIFAEVVLFEERFYPVTAIALSEGLSYLLPRHQFHCLLEIEDFRNDFIRILLKKQRYLANQILYLMTHDVEKRFFLFLRDHYGYAESISPELSKKDIASAIGTSPETLSRLLFRLKDTLTWERKRITIRQGFWEEWSRENESGLS
jgi:CRP/FNR family transcriptional regulator